MTYPLALPFPIMSKTKIAPQLDPVSDTDDEGWHTADENLDSDTESESAGDDDTTDEVSRSENEDERTNKKEYWLLVWDGEGE